MANTNVLQITPDELRDLRNDAKWEGLRIAQQDPNITPETDLEGFQNQGGYAPDPEPRAPGPITPRQKGNNVRRGDAAQRRNEAARGGEQLTPEEIWPNYPNMMQSNPLDDLKIDPNKKPLTPRQKATQDKLRRRAGSGQQGASTAKDILERKGGSAVDIPTFLQNINIDPKDALMIIPALLQLLNPLQLQIGNAEGVSQEQLLANLPPEALDALRRGAKKGLNSREIRDILKPYTQNDQFGRPSGSMRT